MYRLRKFQQVVGFWKITQQKHAGRGRWKVGKLSEPLRKIHSSKESLVDMSIAVSFLIKTALSEQITHKFWKTLSKQKCKFHGRCTYTTCWKPTKRVSSSTFPISIENQQRKMTFFILRAQRIIIPFISDFSSFFYHAV